MKWIIRLLVLFGTLLLAWVIWSYFFGEPITGYIAHERQGRALRSYERRAGLYHSRGRRGRQSRSQCPLMAADRYHVAVGKPWGVLAIPRLGLRRVVVMQGTEDVPSELETGPGHYPTTANPCAGKTVAIAGHRTTYGAWFRHIDDLERGDRIYLRVPYGRFVYEVVGHKVVEPTDVGVVRNIGYDRLVLSACNPPYSAAQRWIVFARKLH